MKREGLRLMMLKYRYPKLMSIMLAVTVAFSLGISQGNAAQSANTNQVWQNGRNLGCCRSHPG